jgi:Putative transposase
VPAGQSRQQVENLLNKLGRQKWNVHIRERYPHGHGVLIYLARYLRGGPIAPQRWVLCDGQQVVFWYTERAKGPGGQAKQRTMSLAIEQFIGRWRIHVPSAGAVRVRCWGLYAHNQGDELAVCLSHWGQGPVEAPKAGDWQRDGGQGTEEPVECCPVCGQRLVCVTLVPRAGAPPPVQAVWKQVA